jgi:plastocyanin
LESAEVKKKKFLKVAMVLLLVIGAGFLAWYIKQPNTNLPAKLTNNKEKTTQNSFLDAVDVAQVSMTSSGFSPKAIRVKAGTVVTWTNTDTAPHGLKSTDLPVLDTDEPLNQSDQYSFTFEQAGTYSYSDPLLPGATGTVTVE